MKRILALVLLSAAAFASAAAQMGKDNPAPGSAAAGLEQELKSLTRELHDALLRGDKEYLFNFFAEDFIGTSYEGYTVTKQDLVKNFRQSPAEAKIARDIEDYKVRATADTAIVTYHLIERVEIGGKKVGGQYLYTDTFVRRDNRWLLLASHATRLEPERRAAKVDPSVYNAYIGEYAMTPSLIFTVTREGDKLIGVAPGGEKVELLPENETTFFIRGRSGQTVFVKDERGQVTHMIFRGQGEDHKIEKIN